MLGSVQGGRLALMKATAVALATTILVGCITVEAPSDSTADEPEEDGSNSDPENGDAPPSDDSDSSSSGPHVQQHVITRAINDTSGEIATAIEEHDWIDRVRRFEIDDDGVLHLELGSTRTAPEELEELAWVVTRDLRYLWDDEQWSESLEGDPNWWPDFKLSIAGNDYVCTEDVMRDPQRREIGRDGWDEWC